MSYTNTRDLFAGYCAEIGFTTSETEQEPFSDVRSDLPSPLGSLGSTSPLSTREIFALLLNDNRMRVVYNGDL